MTQYLSRKSVPRIEVHYSDEVIPFREYPGVLLAALEQHYPAFECSVCNYPAEKELVIYSTLEDPVAIRQLGEFCDFVHEIAELTYKELNFGKE